MTTKEEKLDKLENKITNELESIDDPDILRKKLDSLLIIVQIKKFREVKDV